MKADSKTILAIVLVIVAVGVVAWQFLGGTSSSAINKAKKVAAASTPSAAQPAASSVQMVAQEKTVVKQSPYDKLIARVSERDLAYRAQTFRNPMAPLVPEPSTGTIVRAEDDSTDEIKGYSIKGIIWNDAQPLALINDQVVGVGERLEDGALITEINPNSVKFSKRGKRYVLVLREE